MHVAFVTPEFVKDSKLYPGGLATYIHTTAKTLIRLGTKVTVYLISDRDCTYVFDGIRVEEVANRCPLLARPLARIMKAWTPFGVNRIVGSWCVNRRLAKDRKAFAIDIIQYTNWKSTGLFRLKKGSLIRISSYEKLLDNNPTDLNPDKRFCVWLEAVAYRRFEFMFGPGRYIAEQIKRDLGLKNEIRIIPTPVELNSQPSDRIFRKEGMKMVMFAGTLSRIKGARLLLEIMDLYLSEFKDTIFLIAGKTGALDGTSSGIFLDRLREKHPDHILYHPHLEKPDLLAAYSQTDAMLIPSMVDNFPNTALEAASQGAVIIASNTSSLEPFIENGRNGIILYTRDANTWIASIRETFEMGSHELEAMRVEMRKSLESHKSDVAVRSLRDLYRSVLAKEKA